MPPMIAATPISLAILAGSLCCSDECPRPRYESAASYVETLDEWAGSADEDGERPRCTAVVEGTCADGKRFLAQGVSGAIAFTSEVRYFDDAGGFTGGAFAGDIVMNGCAGYAGPSRSAVRCKDPVGAAICR